MRTRVLAALAGIALLLPVLLWGGVPGVDALCWLVLPVALHEFAGMTLSDRPAVVRWALYAGGALVFATTLYAGGSWAGGAALAVVILAFLAVMAARQPLGGAHAAVGAVVLGSLYAGGLLAQLALLRRLDRGLAWLLFLLAVVWASDSGAYFAGRALGRHRMAPALSPKKTWEGLAGGLLAGALAGWLVAALGLPGVGAPLAVLLGLWTAVAGVLGDLAESLLKRSVGVKDSGRFLPGHGGALDRIDSLLFAAAALHLALLLLGSTA